MEHSRYFQILHSNVFNNKTMYFVILKEKNEFYIIFDNKYEIFLINNREYLKIFYGKDKKYIFKIYDTKPTKGFYFNKNNMTYSVKYNSNNDNNDKVIFNFEIPKFGFLQEKFKNIH